MPRPKGSKNKATLAREAGAAPGGMGHNSGNLQGLDDNQRMALHHRHVTEYEKALEKKKAADSDFKTACKIIKADGDSVADVKRTIEIRKDPDAEKTMRDDIERLLRISRWNALSVGSQADIFGADMRPLADRAEEEGRIAGMRREPAKSPYVEAEAEQRWLKGWHEGQAKEVADTIKAPGDGNLIKGAQNKAGEPDDFDKTKDGHGDDWPDETQVKNRGSEPAEQQTL